MSLETHGRWPVVGAAGLLPISAAASKRPALRPLAALLWHQTEEWVWPGSFLPWINREVLGSDEDEFPIDRVVGFTINVVFGWGLSLATIAGPRAATPTTALYVSHLGNAALHVSWAIRNRRYDPGVVTAIATLVPTAISGLRGASRDTRVTHRAQNAGVIGGVLLSTGLVPMLKLRMHARSRSRSRLRPQAA
jgi:hypothetical protein